MKSSVCFLLWPGPLWELSWDRCVPTLERGATLALVAGQTPQPLLHHLGHPHLSPPGATGAWTLLVQSPPCPRPPPRSLQLPQASAPSGLQVSENILKITLDGTLVSKTLLLTSDAGQILVECLLLLDADFPKV